MSRYPSATSGYPASKFWYLTTLLGYTFATSIQQVVAYVESVRLRMIAQGIPFEVPRTGGKVKPGTQVSVFDRLGPPLLVSNYPADFRPRQVRSVVDIPPRRNQPATIPIVERWVSHPDDRCI
ncbi:hypothetical protein LWI28_004816 [Acer negundo]|uniref:Uncharacterized protein n=1 Tax=Acer negundo TaxID=4023 RepID=A0AAD5IYN9_ACENE|nr:hypothetical protein LWI28_004816 [Acer negundo]